MDEDLEWSAEETKEDIEKMFGKGKAMENLMHINGWDYNLPVFEKVRRREGAKLYDERLRFSILNYPIILN